MINITNLHSLINSAAIFLAKGCSATILFLKSEVVLASVQERCQNMSTQCTMYLFHIGLSIVGELSWCSPLHDGKEKRFIR